MDASLVTCHPLPVTNINLYIFKEAKRGALYGIGTYVRELIVALKYSHINVCVVHLRSDKPQIQTEEIDGTSHWHFPKPVAIQQTIDQRKQDELYFRNVVYLLQLYIENKKDLMFHFNYSPCYKLAEELRKVFDCKIVAVSHYSKWGFKVFDNLHRLRNMLNKDNSDSFAEDIKKSFEEEKLLYSNVDHVVCLSIYMKEILYRDYGLDLSKISVIPNGLSDALETKPDVKLLRNKWKVPLREKIIFFAGRMDEVKGLSFLIKAFREVLNVYPKCRLVIAGDGNYNTYTIESQDICTKIIYTGFSDKIRLYEWYRIADVGVIPSLFEPFGYVAVEMMMHELPIVATATSGLNEVVDDACGLKVAVIQQSEGVEIDAILLSEKILYLLQHPEDARKMGKNGRKRYLKEYSSSVFRNNMLEFYSCISDIL